MAVKKCFSNKKKTGWRENPGWVSPDKLKKGEKQKDFQKKYYSWGYDIDLEPSEVDESGAPKRNRKRESGFASSRDAERAAARQKYTEKDERYNAKKTIYPLVHQVLQSYLDRLVSKRERQRAKTIFNRWLLLIPPLKITELSMAHLNLYIQNRRGQIKDTSINREMNNIASALHNGYQDFPVLESWVCPRIPRCKVKRSRRERLITRAEIKRIISFLFERQADDESAAEYRRRTVVGQAFQMAVLTGARIGEIAAMRWEHVDWDGRILQIYGKKTAYVSDSVVRYLELTPTMESILLDRKQAGAFGDFVFCRTGNSITDYYEILRKAAGRAGVPYGKGKDGAFVTHDARHTAITNMLQSGIDLSTIGSITGHSDKTLILHYGHATRESRRVAGKVLDDFADLSGGYVN